MLEGILQPDGKWIAGEGSPFRSLSVQEVSDLRQSAELAQPIFGGPHNATWEQTHPLAREVYERRGLKTKDA